MPVSPAEAAREHAALLSSLEKAANDYPKPKEVVFTYGTAGFRTKADQLPSVVFRVALLAILRSKRLNGSAIGVMVTASHNPEADNGVKLVDPSGEMLDQSWEAHATALSNCPTTGSLISTFTSLASRLRVDLSAPASIVYARDTRPSGAGLIAALEKGLMVFESTLKTVDVGITTTPILHYVVKATNDKKGEYGKPTVEGYYEKMAAAFKILVGRRGPLPTLFVDCANGVGAPALSDLSKYIGEDLPFRPLNTSTDSPGALNSHCGADYVKTKQSLPPSVASSAVLAKPGSRGCSLDGDADRIIYYYQDGNKFRLLDGDKIAVMVAMYFGDLVNKTGLEGDEKLKVGVVQTAYANGNATKYLETRKIPVTCVSTGVKHLHHAARQFGIGVYFEANGHGTILFSPFALQTLRDAQSNSPESANAIKQLLAFSELINQAVGDALSDMLLVEIILAHRGWGTSEWDAAYDDLPNRLFKVEVPNRMIFVATDAERRLESPPGLQERIDESVSKYRMGRAFVRPSGTEDCVRVYAEAQSSAEVDAIGSSVIDLVRRASGLT